MTTAEQVNEALKQFSKEVSKSAEAEFEKVWAEAIKKPEFNQVLFMKKIFQLFFVNGYESGAIEAATKMFTEAARWLKPT